MSSEAGPVPVPGPCVNEVVAALSCERLQKSFSECTSFFPFFNKFNITSNVFKLICLSIKSRLILFLSCFHKNSILDPCCCNAHLFSLPNFKPKYIHSQFIPICSCVSMAFSLNSCFPCLIFTSLKCLQRMGEKTDGYHLTCNLY